MMGERISSRQLKVPVTNLLRRVFTQERFKAYLDIGVGEHGLFERGGHGGLKLDLRLESSPDGIRIRGQMTGTVYMDCTRCLEEYGQELDIEVDEFYRRPGLGIAGTEQAGKPPGLEIPEEDEYIIDEGTIDLNALVNDLVILSLPIKHLCKEDCKGLCKICGANLNLKDCGCVQESLDPRLEVLKSLLDREEG
jgi:uncharacterized protein